MMTTPLRRSMAFFNKKISQKYGEKCCRYNQNGKPLSSFQAEAMFNNLEEFMAQWHLEESHTRLRRYFFF